MVKLLRFILLLVILGLFHVVGMPQKALAQTDTEFWFVAPNVTTKDSQSFEFNFQIVSLELPTRVTVEMPANPGFVPIIIDMPANAHHTLELPKANIHNLWNFPPDQVNKRGFHITSTTLITVYYEIGTSSNPDMFPLKGRNGIGNEFYVPFQNVYDNDDINTTDKPYSKIDVVATQDNTTVTFYPLRDAHPDITALQPFTITLNKGETYGLAPRGLQAGGYPWPAQLAENRLTGTRVVADKPIAVTTSDDSVNGGPHSNCKGGLIGDQLIPMEIIGTEYIVMRGQVGRLGGAIHTGHPEYIFIVGTENNTDVFIAGEWKANIGDGQTFRYQFLDGFETYHIRTTHPVYVYHVSGIGCALGGAVLPAINDCTGSVKVGFARSKTESFYMNIMVRAGAENGFILNGDGPNTIISGDKFQPVPGTDRWLSAVFTFNNVNVIKANVANLIENTMDVFHLGIINGHHGSGTLYGYFSDYSRLKATSMIAEASSELEAFCYGHPIQLIATGGTNYSWSPPDFLDDPFSATPIARPDRSMRYEVTVSGACDLVDFANVTVQVADPLHAVFTIDDPMGCSPFDLEIFNESIGVQNYSWRFGDGQTSSSNLTEFNHRYVNETDTIQTFDLLLVGRNDVFCVDSMSTMITVYPQVISNAETQILGGCAPLTVEFQNTSQGGSSYFWNYGDGGSSSQSDPVHVFHNYTDTEINYQVVLETKNEFGCKDLDDLFINVKPFVKAGFEFDPHDHCSPFDLEITNASFGGVHQIWNFGDGLPDQSIHDTSFVYPFENSTQDSLIFYISQTVSNDYGCIDTLVRPLIVYPPVSSVFVASQLEGCNPLAVSFENLSSGAATYSWDFGQGQGNASVAEPVLEFFNPDTEKVAIFQVALVTESIFGCKDVSSVDITVYPRIEAAFAFDYSVVCAPEELTFHNLSVGGISHVWNFGDGSTPVWSDQPTAGHVFASAQEVPVSYPVSLGVQNAFGCFEEKIRDVLVYPEIKAGFTTETSGCHPLEVEFENVSVGATKFSWNFGDGGSSSLVDPSRTFINHSHLEEKIFAVKLIAESPSGCIDTMVMPVTVFPKPKASFNLSMDEGCAPLEVQLVNQSIGNTFNTWNVGDGSPDSFLPGNLQHSYLNEQGDVLAYNPHLQVSNDFGCTDGVQKVVTVFPMVKAAVSLSDLAGCHPFEVQLTNNTTGGTAVVPFYWNYGDGNSSTDQGNTHMHVFENFSHTESVTYSTKLLAHSVYGCKDSLAVDLEVYPRPKALFSSPTEPACSPFEVVFTDLSMGVATGSYFWEFGDGSQSTERGNANNIYSQPAEAGLGWFTASLTVENEFGCGDSHEGNVGVFPGVVADFSTEEEGCHPLNVTFGNNSMGAIDFQWDFADGSRSNLREPHHVFFNNSNTNISDFEVNLQATSEFNCKAAVTKNIRVFPMPGTDFTVSEIQGCSPLVINLDNTSRAGQQFLWNIDSEGIESLEDSFSWTLRNLTGEVRNIPVTLDADNQWGCTESYSQNVAVYPEVKAGFTTQGDIFEGCTPLSLPFINQSQRADQYTWEFGDGTLSTGKNPGHLFYAPGVQTIEYDVLLKAASPYGCTDTIMRKVVVHPRPVADFSATPNDQYFPSSTIHITNLSLPGQWRYTWDMGDNNTLKSEVDPVEFSHTYQWEDQEFYTRKYNVNLKVENDWCQDVVTRQVVIRAPHPLISFAPNAQGCPPFEVQFTNYSQYGTANFWDFDDGSHSTDENPRHTFMDPGHYQVKLIVSGEGGIDSTYRIITVHQPPIANFKVVPSVVNLPHESVQMVNLSSTGNTYHWDFGDGNGSDAFSPAHLYSKAGTYDITLTVGSGTDPICYDTLVQRNAARAEDACEMHFPNAFVPSTTGESGGLYVSGDPLNQVFYPVYDGIEEYTLEIYSRWGELLFRSEDLEIGWDGYYRGVLSKMDVYVWKVSASCFNGKKIKKAGDVTLYR